jgi:hypothetical protein
MSVGLIGHRLSQIEPRFTRARAIDAGSARHVGLC